MFVIIGIAAALAYVAAAMQPAGRLRAGLPIARPENRRFELLGVAGVALHAIVLYDLVVVESALRPGVLGAASMVGWVCALGTVVAALVRPTHCLGLVVLPIAAAAVLAGLVDQHPPAGPGPALGVRIHVFTSILAYGLLSLALTQVLLVAVQAHLLATRPAGAVRLLPPLMTQENLLFELVGTGFIALSLGIVSGIVFVEDLFAQHLVHKTALSLAAWAIFGVALWGRWHRGWRGRTARRLILGGFAFLVLAYFGSKAVLEVILDRHWFAP